ncbi:MAG: HlyD family secretion protein [Rhodospirillaceae bacterium]|nr:MAG: HlyD family secretion protein [Rhodospirillaceae bacterium]
MNIERPIISAALRAERPARLDPVLIRRLAIVGVPALVLIIGAGLYILGGRYVDTDDAYAKADFASVTPGASGDVTEVLVTENQAVTKGQPLVKLSDDEYRIAAAAGESSVDSAKNTIESNRAQYRQKVASLAMAQTDSDFAARELKRQSALAASNNVSISRLDEARHAYESAQQKIALLKEEEAEFLAKLQGNPDLPVEQYASYQMALANKAGAEYMLSRTTVFAPFDGIVSHLPKPGDYGRTGVPLLNIVSTRRVWVDANFKETQLTYMRPGQSVDVSVDTYPDHVFHGHVESIAQASGSEFALLPAQNSTGNWIKVVQRIPVRVAIDQQPSDGGPVLRSGMSVIVDVDTGYRRLSRWFGAGNS